MKVGLINFHYAHNYGAVLQCTALKYKLEKLGCDVMVIDYRPEYQMQLYLEKPNPFIFAKHTFLYNIHINLLLCAYRTIKGFINILKTDSRKHRELIDVFEPFVEKELNLTARYNNFSELQNDPPDCDIYICGSDQIWNPANTFGLDPAYFLNFGNPHVKASYAASPNKQLDLKVYSKKLKMYCNGLDYISLRENERKKDFEELLQREIQVCPDPTLFLSDSEYEVYEEEIEEAPNSYILVYEFKERDNSNMKTALSRVYNELGLKVIDISLFDEEWDIPFTKKFAVSPGEFLTYMKNAAFIVTNSFHGTAFSIIYRKNFITVEYSKTSSRMKELIQNLGLNHNLFDLNRKEVYFETDYYGVDERIASLTNVGEQYLKTVIAAG